jgi:hypothetical protein
VTLATRARETGAVGGEGEGGEEAFVGDVLTETSSRPQQRKFEQ